MTTTPSNVFTIASAVEFQKVVAIAEQVDISKEITALAAVLGNSAVANATADANGFDTTAETLTQASTNQLTGSFAQSESVAATNNPAVHIVLA